MNGRSSTTSIVIKKEPRTESMPTADSTRTPSTTNKGSPATTAPVVKKESKSITTPVIVTKEPSPNKRKNVITESDDDDLPLVSSYLEMLDDRMLGSEIQDERHFNRFHTEPDGFSFGMIL